MARRSSARLRSQDSVTPKRVSLSHDPPTTRTRTPRTVPARLASLQEKDDDDDDMPGAFSQSASPNSRFELEPVLPGKLAETATPTKAVAIKPAEREMHPQLHHQSTAKPRDEARHLGFSNMAPHTEPSKHTSRIAMLQSTPSKARNLEEEVKNSPGYQFTFRREHSLELSPEAKKLMHEKREEAARIREQMVADGEALPPIDEVLAARKIAKPKGRFSQVHLREFEKMESIASHPSAMRQKLASQPGRDQTPRKDVALTAKSLKRSPSKAGFDHSSTPSRPASRDQSKPLPTVAGSQLPRTTSVKDLKKAAAVQPAASTKRIKRAETDDVSMNRPGSSEDDKPLPATPQPNKQLQRATSIPNVSALATPTQASLARTASVKSVQTTKIPAPAFAAIETPVASSKKQVIQVEGNKASPALLARSPSKPSFFAKPTETTKPNTRKTTSPLLSRSPFKAGGFKKAPKPAEASDAELTSRPAALLARSPVKGHVAQAPESKIEAAPKAPVVPFLSRSPTKIPMAPAATDEVPDKSTSKKLFSRFNLLRQSPMKSILRSPQRLYSDDPAKVAAGTHLATPEKNVKESSKAPSDVLSSNAARKHVDFTSSTKARYAKAQSSTPSKTPTPSPNMDHMQDVATEPGSVSYPELPTDVGMLSPSPQKRRQTSGPQDFTFRAGSQDIVFGRSTDHATVADGGNRRSTIRMVTNGLVPSPAPVVGSKKRKFEFENKPAAAKDDGAEEKENTPVIDEAEEESEQRPAKRAKSSTAGPLAKPTTGSGKSPAPAPARRATLGVKPKGAKTTTSSPVKRTSTISQARLAALSQPKRRG